MPEKARIFIAEDDLRFQKYLDRELNNAGHSVVLKATTLDEAMKAIKEFEALKVQVAIVDGNLSANDTSGYDGQTLVKAIGRLAPNVKTVGMSSSTIEGVTIDLGKRNYSKICEVVTNL